VPVAFYSGPDHMEDRYLSDTAHVDDGIAENSSPKTSSDNQVLLLCLVISILIHS